MYLLKLQNVYIKKFGRLEWAVIGVTEWGSKIIFGSFLSERTALNARSRLIHKLVYSECSSTKRPLM